MEAGAEEEGGMLVGGVLRGEEDRGGGCLGPVVAPLRWEEASCIAL